MAAADTDAKLYTLQEVSEHNNSKDCWLIIGGKVYDVTRFLEDHPGGDEVLLSATGKDATDDFEDVGHSTSARGMMEEYYVGKFLVPLGILALAVAVRYFTKSN
ncbi:hypothetical protein O6H91_23G063500 [Diphasiastrum complanatum]|uniref:Uncharacterized protein n=1 Tax=Diphasiastrum complanatum TaxID=34168 RepID=A0ACC2ABD3_DIPCM|nr:hypothetical protein O6H91_23G063500 [Diphasiastrum complanatum]